MNQENHELQDKLVREQLERILSSNDFNASQRIKNLLRYLVEETLSKRAHRIKAYSIATAVFGRPSEFDPQSDPIVRIEASRLRRRLETYYLKAGVNDPVRISIPTGSYAASFEFKEFGLPAENGKSKVQKLVRANQPSIFVTPFEKEGDQSRLPNVSEGFTRQVIVALTRFSELFVYGPHSTFEFGKIDNLDKLRDQIECDYVLSGGVWLSRDRFGVEALLTDATSGRVVWAEQYERSLEPDNIFRIRDEIASSIAGTVGQPYGMIYSNKAKESDGKPPDKMNTYDHIIQFYKYWNFYDIQKHELIRKKLEEAIINDPHYAEAYACLSQIYTDAHRFSSNLNSVPDNALSKAKQFANRAIELAPNSSRGYHALALVNWFEGNIGASIEAYETGLALNPNDPEIAADLGFRYSLLCDWEKALPLLEESYARNPAQPNTFRLGFSLYHLMQGNFERSLEEAKCVEAPQIVYGYLVEVIAAFELNRTADMMKALDRIRAIDPNYNVHILDDLEKRKLNPELIKTLVDSFQLAWNSAYGGVTSPMPSQSSSSA